MLLYLYLFTFGLQDVLKISQVGTCVTPPVAALCGDTLTTSFTEGLSQYPRPLRRGETQTQNKGSTH